MKFFLIIFVILFLSSCSSEPYPDEYACKNITHGDDVVKICGPIFSSACTTTNGQDGRFYSLNKCPYEEGWDDMPTNVLNSERICLSDSYIKQKEAQAEIDPYIKYLPKCQTIKIEI